MTQEKKDKLIAVLKNYNNIASMIEDLLEPVSKVMEKHSCNDEEACKLKIEAEDYLSKYGKLTMDATTKAVRTKITAMYRKCVFEKNALGGVAAALAVREANGVRIARNSETPDLPQGRERPCSKSSLLISNS